VSPYEVPAPDEVTKPWWDATRTRQLLIQQCSSCATRQHPPRALCVGCGSIEHLGWITASGQGSVDAFTVVHRSPLPDLPTPYIVARVRLAEGPLLLTNIVTDDHDTVTAASAVSLDWRPLPDGRALPVFRISQED